MPLGKGIAEVFGAIPERIEVSGHEPTWKVTGGSFESVLAFAREAYGETTVVAREDRSRWWPRVTLTVTRDPVLAAAAPDLATFASARRTRAGGGPSRRPDRGRAVVRLGAGGDLRPPGGAPTGPPGHPAAAHQRLTSPIRANR